MNKQQLQGAISKIHASLRLTQEVCVMKTEKKTATRGKITKAVVIAAIIVAFAATTALAAPAIHRALTGGHISTDRVFWVRPKELKLGERYLRGQTHNIYVDVQMNEDAPSFIEKFYMPILENDYEQQHGCVYKDKASATYTWTRGADNWRDRVRFYQTAGGTYDPEEVCCSVVTHPCCTPEAALVQLAGIQGYLVEKLGLYGARHFLWSDGDYLFHLEVPDEYTDADIEKILKSITVVEDILPYCVSMTPEDKETVFG